MSTTPTALSQALALARACGRLDPRRVEKAGRLLSDRRTVILPDGRIDFPSETRATFYLASVQTCDCPDHRAGRHVCAHMIGAMALRRAAEIETTCRMLSGEARGLIQ